MSTADMILATLDDSGPADFAELTLALHVAEAERLHVHPELYMLIRACKVTVVCGIYSVAK